MCKRVSSIVTIVGGFVGWVIAGALSPCEAQVVGTFEHNLSSSVGTNWVSQDEATAPLSSYSDYVSTGATDGGSALALHVPTGWTIDAVLKGGLPLAQAAATHDFLVIDATTTDNGVAGDGWSPAWRQLFVVFNSNQGGWQQNQIDFPVAGDDGGSLTTPVILDLAASGIKANAQAYVNSGGGQGTYWELFLPMQGGDQGTVVKAGNYASADNVVNAADYITWRKKQGGTALDNETVTPGSVDSADYDEWRSHFGNDYAKITTIIDNVRFANAGAGAGLAPSGVPEPTSALLLLTSALALAAFRRRSA